MKILIIRFSSIGDIILTTPVIRNIKRRFPDAQLHFATKIVYADIIESNPYVDRMHLFGQDSLTGFARELRKENFDFIVDLHKNIRTLFIRLMLQKPSGSFDKLNFKKWLLVNFKINCLPDISIVDRYYKAVSKLSVTNDQEGLDYFFPPGFDISLPEKYKLSPHNYIAIVLGAKFFTKKYPSDKWIEVINALPIQAVLLGGKDALQEATIIAGKTKALNLVGQCTLHESALILKFAKKVTTHDTGLMHIAAALNKDIVSLWGNTIPAFGMYPYFGKRIPNSTILEVSDLACRPCSKLGYKKKCPKGHFKCMNMIAPQQVVKALD